MRGFAANSLIWQPAMQPGKPQTAIVTQNTFARLRNFFKTKKYDRHILLCDEGSFSACLPLLIQGVPELAKAEIIEIESGEHSKNIEVCAGIWQSLAEQRATRNTLLVNVGGGVVCDLGGFCAATFKRGIPFIYVPTTLLAMVDASIGGKTGVDLGHLKNAVGVFANPEAVFIEPLFLQTLPQRHVRNGLAELLKIAAAHDAKLFMKLSAAAPSYQSHRVIRDAAKLKQMIVGKDPFDRGLRKSLNFGHSIGHAIESIALQNNHDVLHGEAIAVGMMVECIIAREKKLMAPDECNRINEVISSFYSPLPFIPVFEAVEPFLVNDKKNSGDKMLFALVTRLGRCRVDVPVTRSQVKKALRLFIESSDDYDKRR